MQLILSSYQQCENGVSIQLFLPTSSNPGDGSKTPISRHADLNVRVLSCWLFITLDYFETQCPKAMSM
jgi:hypothetical protein